MASNRQAFAQMQRWSHSLDHSTSSSLSDSTATTCVSSLISQQPLRTSQTSAQKSFASYDNQSEQQQQHQSSNARAKGSSSSSVINRVNNNSNNNSNINSNSSSNNSSSSVASCGAGSGPKTSSLSAAATTTASTASLSGNIDKLATTAQNRTTYMAHSGGPGAGSSSSSAASAPVSNSSMQRRMSSVELGARAKAALAAASSALPSIESLTSATSTSSLAGAPKQQRHFGPIFGQQQSPLLQQRQPTPPTSTDVTECVYQRLLTFDAFRALHASMLRKLCAHAYVERIDKHVILFKQGDEAINWYAILDGSVEIRVAPAGQKDVVGVCTLGVGTTFGASGITSGKTHSVSAITSDECTLLRVRRADFEQIFQSTTSLTPSMLLGMAPSDSQDQSPPSGGGGSGGGGGLVDMWHNANNYGMSASNCAWTGQKQQQLASTSSQRSSLTSGGGGGGGSMTTTPIASGDKHRQQQQQEYTGSSMTAAGGQQQEQFNQQMQGQQQQSDNRSSGSGNNMANFNDADLNGPEAIEIALANQEADADDAASDAGSCSSGTDEVLRLAHASAVLRTLIHAHARAMLQDRHVVFAASDQALDNRNNNNQETNNQQQQQQPAPQVVQNAMAGSEMVDWLMGVAGELVGGTMRGVHTRLQASAMWHALLEVGELHAVGGCARAQPCVAMGVCQCGHATTSANESSTSHTQQLAGPAAAYINFNSLKMAPRASAFKCSTAAAAGTTRTNSNSNNSMCAQQRQAPRFRDESHVLYRFKWDQPSCAANNNVDCNNNNSNSNWGAHSSAKFPPIDEAECALLGVVVRLARLAPSASFRLVLAKPAAERTHDELELVYDELRHIKALSHLSQSAKKELAARVAYEHHARANECVFQQGEPGHSWYVILRGSVHVIIDGKGTVCSLHAGDDFGKLALINEAPRAATIVTGEPYCYFLRVDKHDFDQILRHLEANTVRLQEHGKEVLILQRVVAKDSASESGKTSAGVVTSSTLLGTCNDTNNQVSSSSTSSTTSVANNNISMAPTAIGGSNTSNNNHHLINAANLSAASGGTATDVATLSSSNLSSSSAANKQVTFKYTVMAGTPEKMLEHLLETRIDGHVPACVLGLPRACDELVLPDIYSPGDTFLEDFILTHMMFMPTPSLCAQLTKHYTNSSQQKSSDTTTRTTWNNTTTTTTTTNTTITNNSRHSAIKGEELALAKKRRVVKFVQCWMVIERDHFIREPTIHAFIKTLQDRVMQDALKYRQMQAELNAVTRILEARKEYEREMKTRGVLTWVADSRSSILPIRRNLSAANTFNVSQHQNKAAAAEQRESTVERNNEAQERADELLVQQVHERQRRLEHRLEPICGTDEIIFRVYCADHTYTTLRTRVDSTAAHIKLHAASKLGLSDKHRDLVLVQVKSNGERLPYDDTERNVATNLSVNGRLFVAPVDHIDALTPLPEQDLYQHRQGKDTHALLQALVADRNDTGLTTGTPMGAASKLDEFSSQDVAYCLTQMAWSLVDNVHEYELLYSVLATRPSSSVAMQALAGSSSSSSLGPGGGGPPVTANLNILLRHFNELQYWVVTEICLCQSVSKRVQILRKFIKIAAHCKELQNLNAFFAIIMGLSNMAVARLNATWERLTSKLKRTFSQFESLIDPSRNHRRYRLFIAKMTPPIIPFMPLLLKDMTFAHDGNKTYLDNGLTNFEKMQMIAQTLRTIRYCKSRPMRLHPSQCKTKTSLRSIEMFFRDLKVIDNQRTLSQLSHSLEHRKP